MQSLASCSSSSSTESRWSGIAFEHRGLAGAARPFRAGGQDPDARPPRRRSRIDASGGTVRVSSLWARYDLERRRAARLGQRLGDEALDVQGAAAARPCSAPRRRRAAARDRSSRPGCPVAGLAEQAVQVEQAGLVLRPDRDPVAVGAQLVEEGHGGALPSAVDEPPLGAGRLCGGDHRQHRGDADAAGDEQVARRGDEREVVAGPRTRTVSPGCEPVVHVDRPAAASGSRRIPRRHRWWSAGSPHSEYWRVGAPSRTRSTWAPGSHVRSGSSTTSRRVRATTPSARTSLPLDAHVGLELACGQRECRAVVRDGLDVGFRLCGCTRHEPDSIGLDRFL